MPPPPPIPCATCQTGQLTPKRVHRMSGPAVLIGYLILIPSILGILGGGGCTLLMGGAGAAAMNESSARHAENRSKSEREFAESEMVEANVPDAMIARVLAGETIESDERATLGFRTSMAVETAAARLATPDRNEYLDDLELISSAEGAGVALGAGMGMTAGVIVMIGSLMSGLLGFLLVMKKRVLQCRSCDAVVAAS